MSRAPWLPVALLVAYGVAFASRALGVTPLAFDDHPGQLARLWHVVREGPAPWAWNAGWWAGYPEMQFYPPGWFYVGAALSWVTLGALAPPAIYHALVWVTYLAPGLTTFLLLRRLLGNATPFDGHGPSRAWPALPGAFVVLTFTGDPAGGAASGVEGGVHIGMIAARLAWALLPLLFLTLVPWIEAGGRFPRFAVLIVAAIVLTHPAHTPAAVAVLAAGVLATPARRRALGQAALASIVALVLAAFWVAPLLSHVAETRALAWGTFSPSAFATPLTALLVAFALVAGGRQRSRPISAVLHAVWLAALAVTLDARVAEPLGVSFLPTDRVADGAWMTLLIASGVGAGMVLEFARRHLPVPVAALAVVGALVVFSLPGQTLTLWARPSEWPSQASVTRGLRLDDLWAALRAAPPGRVLFLRSGVPLVYGTAWYRPHTHVTALTPVTTGREILGGTFTHGSPIAALVYRGDAGRAPITRLAEQLDGEMLFGRRLEALDTATFDAHARRFRVGSVVALEDDAPRLPFLADNPRYRRLHVPPFLVFVAVVPPPPARRVAANVWDVPLSDPVDGWAATGVTYYPLWRAERDGAPLTTRRSAYGDLEVRADSGATSVRLVYGPGIVELAALALSFAAAVGLAADAWMRRRAYFAGGAGVA